MMSEIPDLKIGDRAPEFSVEAVGGEYGEGKRICLKELRGQTVVLYFYPKDQTPGCTTQACGLRDGWSEIGQKATVFGVSIDSASSHRKFIQKQGLPFALLSDETHELVERYGVWVEKSLYGRTYMGTERTTFVIDPKGKIQAILRKVKAGDHFNQLLEALAK